MTPASAKRSIALGMITELYFPTPAGQDHGTEFTGTDAEQIAANIDKLAQLGRTERWQAAIRTWSHMVRNHGDDPRSLRWAFLQYLVFAGHAS
jgi:hypothetical protein